MITATVTITTTPTSLRDLINTAVSGRIPAGFWGRAFQIVLIPSAITVVISDRSTPPALGASGVALNATAITQYNFLSPTGNQLALEEIFLSGAGTETVGVIIFTM